MTDGFSGVRSALRLSQNKAECVNPDLSFSTKFDQFFWTFVAAQFQIFPNDQALITYKTRGYIFVSQRECPISPVKGYMFHQNNGLQKSVAQLKVRSEITVMLMVYAFQHGYAAMVMCYAY
jgi:hypothetical protein